MAHHRDQAMCDSGNWEKKNKKTKTKKNELTQPAFAQMWQKKNAEKTNIN